MCASPYHLSGYMNPHRTCFVDSGVVHGVLCGCCKGWMISYSGLLQRRLGEIFIIVVLDDSWL